MELLDAPIVQLAAAIIAAVIIALYKRGAELVEASGAQKRAEAIKKFDEDLYDVGKDLVVAAKEAALDEADKFIFGEKYQELKRDLYDHGNTFLKRAGLGNDLITEKRVDAILQRAAEEVRLGLM